jgi:lipoprotein-anchoring transpeptidase ErfK/SrfK
VEECVNVRSGPGEDYAVVTRLRNGIVLKVGGKVVRGGRTWYKIVFDEWIRYPERVTNSWYVAADYVQVLMDEGNQDHPNGTNSSSTKYIIVERGKQRLMAYDGEELFMEQSISTGRDLTPTPRGTFTVYKKTPSRYMQGPIPGITDKYYDLPGVPWNLYFTSGGAVIHGTYWHDNFGKPSSNGCVNLPPQKAKKLYLWADVGMKVIVRD